MKAHKWIKEGERYNMIVKLNIVLTNTNQSIKRSRLTTVYQTQHKEEKTEEHDDKKKGCAHVL